MEFAYGKPFSGQKLEQVKAFLQTLSLGFEAAAEFTVNLTDDGEIVATGSRQGNVLKCIGVSPSLQGEGISAQIVTELVKNALQEGFTHLFLYTKPQNRRMFSELGFYPVAETPDVLLMENKKNGVQEFVSGLECPSTTGVIGGIVVNCNPFTKGHLYLIETAARSCDLVHLFVLSEDRSEFPADVRMMLVKQGVAHLKNVVVHPTGDYLVSSATFPSYFIKDKTRVDEINCMLDLVIFADYFAKTLHITKRFVGSEPFNPIVERYNRQMELFLPGKGIEVVELPRCEQQGEAISASRVRALLAQDNIEPIRQLVPPSTYAYLEGRMQHDTSA